MKQEQLNAIKERVAKATKGPWASEETAEGHIDIFNPNEDYAICQTGNETYDCLNEGDTEFIKHSITDVPALIVEVERLHKALEKVMEVEAPIMEGWETTAYKIAQNALGGELDGQRKQNHHT
ncbi:hypothetical protein MKX57_17505 [Lysinibacillus sp. FSL M8-0216]|uniref:hypothetical protein n=1 Tax=Lysinibacillus sp. FSL M8-0216 TaxID=2921619 RepID=UPI003159E2AD